MSTRRTLNRLALAATLTFGLACGDDDPTGPPPLTFPDWPALASAAICVRGTAVVGDAKSGTISDVDCDAADINPGDAGYFETWRVRVATARDVTFDANSPFDNYLVIFRVNSVTSTGGEIAFVGDNDDRSTNDLNALVTVALEPNVDYLVGISGIDYTETGQYTLAIR